MSFIEFLKRIPALNLALSGAAVGLTVLRQRLIPDNLDWLTDAGVLVSIVAFLCVFARVFSSAAKKWLLLLATFSLASLLALQISLVDAFYLYQQPYHELRGWNFSEEGLQRKANLERAFKRPLSTQEIILYSGHTEMLELYGANWYLSAALYSGSFLLFLYSVIAVAGQFELAAKKEPRPVASR